VKCPSCGLSFLPESKHYIEKPIYNQASKSISFTDSIKICFSKFIDFSGRASRAEFWWFMLFVVVVGTFLFIVNITLSILFYFSVLVPSLSAAVRRLHDTDRSGWYLFIGAIPFANLLLLYFLIQETKEPNHFETERSTTYAPITEAYDSIPDKSQTQSIAKRATSAKNWTMQTKPTPYWKFLLDVNLFKKYQLDKIERIGDIIYVRVLNGNEQHYKIEDLNAVFIKTKQGGRDFTVKSISDPKRKITFRETRLQMPKKWWDELTKKIGASESATSKFLHAVKDILKE
jgi:uncharacterized membrane protein YhaH (DUF805 family)